MPSQETKKYNHAFTIAFSVDSDNDNENVTERELLAGIANRLKDVIETNEVVEACGLPFDTYLNQETA